MFDERKNVFCNRGASKSHARPTAGDINHLIYELKNRIIIIKETNCLGMSLGGRKVSASLHILPLKLKWWILDGVAGQFQ